MFCDKCKSLMKTDDGKWVCKKCDFTRDIKSDDHKIITTKREEKEVVIIKDEASVFPTTKVRCPKCKNNKAYWRLEQTRAADEPETRIYRCTKCNNTWREY